MFALRLGNRAESLKSMAKVPARSNRCIQLNAFLQCLACFIKPTECQCTLPEEIQPVSYEAWITHGAPLCHRSLKPCVLISGLAGQPREIGMQGKTGRRKDPIASFQCLFSRLRNQIHCCRVIT